MLQLLMKDLQISKRYLLLGFIGTGLFLYLISSALEGLPLALPLALFSYLLILTSSKSDEKNNNGRMLASLPLRRRDIVTAKYGGIFMFTLLAFLCVLLWRIIALIIVPEANIPWFSFHSVYLSLILLFIYFAFYFPVYFAFGARIIQIIEYIIAFALTLIPIFFLRNQEDPGILLDHLTLEKNLYWEGGICLVIMFISWLISSFVYGRRNI